MHYAIWGLAYLAVSFVSSIGVGRLLARASPGPVPARR